MARFVIEGEWTGYNSSQQRIVHRQIVTEKVAQSAKDLRCIVYTDGTSLIVRTRQLAPREKVSEINSYGSLIQSAIKRGGSRVLVTDLPD